MSTSIPSSRQLPHHKLVAYQVGLELLGAVRAAAIRDAKLRDEALRAAKGTCLNIAEGAARTSRADQCRVFGIARAEAAEVAAAVEIAAAAGDTSDAAAAQCLALADRVFALLTGLIRR